MFFRLFTVPAIILAVLGSAATLSPRQEEVGQLLLEQVQVLESSASK
ncbi:hypothetical protein MY11210_007415, partial [Beauveria gryllotalpidicola]